MKKSLLVILLLLFPILVMAEEGTLTIANKMDLKEIETITYTITIEGVKGAKLIKIDDTNDYAIFDSQGTAEIEADNNSTIVINDIPLSSNYSLNIKEIEHYNIYIDGKETVETTGLIEEDTKVTITSKYFGREETVVEEEKQREVKVNPKTSDGIAATGLMFLFAMLLAYTLLRKKTDKYTY